MVMIVPIRPVSGRPAQLGKPRCLFCLRRHRPKRKAIRDSPESFGDAMLFAASPASFFGHCFLPALLALLMRSN